MNGSTALTATYDVLGNQVSLNPDIVKKYLVRGRAELVTEQEIIFFINLCKMQKLNPLNGQDVYLIKYSKEDPAQMVVGKTAYMRRAFENPDYLCKEDGIVVQRGKDIIQKEGCCLYPGESLIGGWCRVHYMRAGIERTAFKEVALSEYSSGKANWKNKPSLMISKVAISQCIREAFPKEYEGLYSEDEMVASGAIPVNYEEMQPTEKVVASQESTISKEQKTLMVVALREHFGQQDGARVLQEICAGLGINSPDKILQSDYENIMAEIEKRAAEVNAAEDAEAVQETVYDTGFLDEIPTDGELPFN